jgi:hypothetical protein
LDLEVILLYDAQQPLGIQSLHFISYNEVRYPPSVTKQPPGTQSSFTASDWTNLASHLTWIMPHYYASPLLRHHASLCFTIMLGSRCSA